ncbi:DNA polymerase Y family protein [Streptomyces sp. NBC_00448]|uniref:DNA polymerase Y family protein n=1 Tax=Streptomyces sp. NBC_00448 TaxID=2903652 RepID=UPI002E1BD97B
MTTPPRPTYIVHLHLHATLTDDQYAEILDALAGITPRLQPFPPDAAQLDITGALRYFDKTADDMVHMIAMRLAGLFGVRTSAGLAPNRMLAAMAAAAGPPGHTTRVPHDPQGITTWLHPHPVTALPGIGRATADTLHRYGLTTIGDVADLPPATLQRLLGAAPARLLAERAHGHDPRPVTPRPAALHLTAHHLAEHDTLDPDQHRRAVLRLTEELGTSLRDAAHTTDHLTLTLRYADRSTTTRTRTLPEPTAHTPDLATATLILLHSLGLQRARVRGYTLRADRLRPATDAHHQLSLDAADHRARAAEQAADRARHRFGPHAVRPAVLADPGPRHPTGAPPRPRP